MTLCMFLGNVFPNSVTYLILYLRLLDFIFLHICCFKLFCHCLLMSDKQNTVGVMEAWKGRGKGEEPLK